MRTVILLTALAVPVAIDVFTCVLALRRNRRGSGPSGFPMVTLVLYAIVIVLVFRGNLLLCATLMLAAFAFHFLLVVGIPMWDSRRLERRRG